jgi:hypothetical protein
MGNFWQILANVATVVATLIAIVAAVYARSQSRDAKAQLKEANSQLEFSKQSGRDDDDRRKKRTAIDLAQEWCRTEAPSPISIMRECLIQMNDLCMNSLLEGESFSLEAQFQGEMKAFFFEILKGHRDPDFAAKDGTINIPKREAELLRNYFARRLNFLEVVSAAYNSNIADPELVQRFFGQIITNNSSYRTAVRLRSLAWPELDRFYDAQRAATISSNA